MGFEVSDRVRELNARLEAFMEEHVYPREHAWNEFTLDQDNRWLTPPWFFELQEKARDLGLWNLFLPHEYAPWSPGLTNVEIAPLFETMSKVSWAQAVFNCNAPDTGNMEVLIHYGSEEQKAEWLPKLLSGEIRSAFCMTEPEYAGSNPVEMGTRAKRDGDDYVIDGHKWFATAADGAAFGICMAVTDPAAGKYERASMIAN